MCYDHEIWPVYKTDEGEYFERKKSSRVMIRKWSKIDFKSKYQEMGMKGMMDFSETLICTIEKHEKCSGKVWWSYLVPFFE